MNTFRASLSGPPRRLATGLATTFTLLAAHAQALPTEDPQPISQAAASAAAMSLTTSWAERPLVLLLALVLGLIVVVMTTYSARHIVFTLSRLFGGQRYPYAGIQSAVWPQITVFVAAHNEEKVIAGCLDALLDTDYPPDRVRIVPVNDRSQDGTKAIIDAYAIRYPERIVPLHRSGGKPGKAAALKEAMSLAEGDIAIIFDADYTPGPGLLRQLTAPFFDPEVGAVMGRVVPVNVGTNLLTRLLDLERSAGYQVDQQARMNLRAVPQYGGTVGGVRRSAVEAVGGWNDDTLTEDTDITFRLLIDGWKTVYNNRAECYEEVPEEWSVRTRQVRRWAKGHNQVLFRSWRQLLTSPFVSLRERIDGLMLLHVFMMPPLLLLGWALALVLYYLNAAPMVAVFIPLLALMAYGALGNFAAFLEIVVAVLIDGHRRRIRLLPFNLLGFFVSLFAITHALFEPMTHRLLGRKMVWHKTLRYRKSEVVR